MTNSLYNTHSTEPMSVRGGGGSDRFGSVWSSTTGSGSHRQALSVAHVILIPFFFFKSYTSSLFNSCRIGTLSLDPRRWTFELLLSRH